MKTMTDRAPLPPEDSALHWGAASSSHSAPKGLPAAVASGSMAAVLLGLLVSVIAPLAGSVSAGMWAAMAIALAGIGWLWIASLRRPGAERPGRITIALAMTLVACSGILWLAEAAPGPAPYGLDLAEYLYLAAAPMLWVGMLQLDRANSRSKALPRTTLLLDMLVLTISGAAFSWYFLMGPYAQNLPAGPVVHVTEIMPYVNIALYGLFSWLLLRPTGSAFSGRQLCFITTVMAANSFLNLRFLDVLQTNTIASFLLIVAVALLILDAHAPARRDRRSPRSDRQRALTIIIAPYIAAFSIVVLLIVSTVSQPSALMRQDMLFWSTLLAFTIVITRQVLTILDNQRLLGSLVKANRTLRHRAEHDALTGLANRQLLEAFNRLQAEMQKMREDMYPTSKTTKPVLRRPQAGAAGAEKKTPPAQKP